MSDDDDILKDDPETDFAAEDEAAERAALPPQACHGGAPEAGMPRRARAAEPGAP